MIFYLIIQFIHMENKLDNRNSEIALLKREIEFQERKQTSALQYLSYPKLKKIKAKIKDLKSRLDDLMNNDD
jgi:hypothetical protein